MAKFTDAQTDAIVAQDGSVLVSAAAGSGKTTVLIERIIRMITRKENPIDVDRLLIVTFTRAAASEMKERLAKAINALLEKDPYNSLLLRQRQLMYNTSICTIDSFCGSIVREYFHVLGVQKDFRLADENEIKVIGNDALETVLEDFYRGNTPEFNALADAFANKNGDDNLRNAVLKIAGFLATQPFGEKWLEDMLSNYCPDIPIEKSLFGKILIKYARSTADHSLLLTLNSIKLLDEDEKLRDANLPLLLDDKAYFEKLAEKFEEGSWDEIKRFAETFVKGRMKTPKGYKDDPIKNAVANSRDDVKKSVDSICNIFMWDSTVIRAEIDYLRIIVSELFEVVRAYLKKFSDMKYAKNMLSFSDVELLTVKLLAEPCGDGYTKTEQAKEISKRFDQIMVDEFQDVNDVQNLIFKCVSTDENNMFVVGDVKQSIYGFRQAKPEIFIDRKNEYNKYDRENKIYPATIILDMNFRSRREVCSAVNFIFKNLMTETSAKMDYGADEYLNVGAVYPPSDKCNFEVDYIQNESTDDSVVNEAVFVANKILKMKSEGFTVGRDNKPLEYGDCAILLRSTKNTATTFVNVLNSLGVPATSEIKESFFDANEIKVMLNFLRCIDNPSLDIPLLSVMCSPVYSFTVDELAKIKNGNRYTNLYSAVVEFAKKDSRTAEFLKELSSLKTYACTCSVDELLSRIYELTSFSAIISAISGAKGIKNLNLLREYARSFESSGYRGLSAFISYMDKLIENGADLESSSGDNGETDNTVKVISIHKSKGLEYPVCFIACSAKKFNKTDLSADVLIDSKAGLGIRRVEGFCRHNTLPRMAVGVEISENEIAEEMRVLYVALTRAKEKLIVISSQKNPTDYLAKLHSKLAGGVIDPYSVMKAKSISDWISMCALVHPLHNELRMKLQLGETDFTNSATDELPWNINFIKSTDFVNDTEEVVADTENNSDNEIYDSTVIDLLKERTDFPYRNKSVLKIPQKVSASDVAHNEGDTFDKIFLKPAFLSNGNSSAVERGTAHHKFLQFCDFKKAKNDLQAELDRLLAEKFLTAEQVASINKSEIQKFLDGSLAKRVMDSPLVNREQRFTVNIKAGMLDSTLEGESAETRVVMQGAIDLVFKEGNELVVVDYKTDRVREIGKLKELYSKQLSLYKQAVEEFTDYKVKECIIYSIHLNDCVVVDC